MKIDKNIDDIIREFTLEILQNNEYIRQLEQKNKEKEAELQYERDRHTADSTIEALKRMYNL